MTTNIFVSEIHLSVKK